VRKWLNNENRPDKQKTDVLDSNKKELKKLDKEITGNKLYWENKKQELTNELNSIKYILGDTLSGLSSVGELYALNDPVIFYSSLNIFNFDIIVPKRDISFTVKTQFNTNTPIEVKITFGEGSTPLEPGYYDIYICGARGGNGGPCASNTKDRTDGEWGASVKVTVNVINSMSVIYKLGEAGKTGGTGGQMSSGGGGGGGGASLLYFSEQVEFVYVNNAQQNIMRQAIYCNGGKGGKGGYRDGSIQANRTNRDGGWGGHWNNNGMGEGGQRGSGESPGGGGNGYPYTEISLSDSDINLDSVTLKRDSSSYIYDLINSDPIARPFVGNEIPFTSNNGIIVIMTRPAPES
jgi:hypothetical protein